MIDENPYDLAIDARKKLNRLTSDIEMLKFMLKNDYVDKVDKEKLLNLQNQMISHNKILNKFEDEWM